MATYYVTQSGAGAADGSDRDNPFSISGHNAATFSAGDVIWVLGALAGTFVPPSSGSAGSPITYRFDDPAEPGSVALSTGTCININGKSHLLLESPAVTASGSANGILLAGTTAGNVINDPVILSTSTGRALYILGNAHTDWEVNRPHVTHGTGDVTSANDSEAVYLWGNNATAGSGGRITELSIIGAADSIADNASAFVGLSIEDMDDLVITVREIRGFHTGIDLQDADDNDITVLGSIADNKTQTNGQGVLLAGTCAGNDIHGGLYSGNYEGYNDASSVGGNDHYGAVHILHEVNGINFGCTGSTKCNIGNNTIIHTPTGSAGHGIVVQQGSANTVVDIYNNLITCSVLGSNVQCIAIDTDNSGQIIDTVTINNNAYFTTNGAHLGALDGVNYDTIGAWRTALASPASGTIVGADSASVFADPQLNENYETEESSIIQSGLKWWATGHLVGYDSEPFPAYQISIGGIQSRSVPGHPVRL